MLLWLDGRGVENSGGFPHCGIPRSWDDSFHLENSLYPTCPQTDCFLHQPGYVDRCSLSFSPRDDPFQRQQKEVEFYRHQIRLNLNSSLFWDSNLVFPRLWIDGEISSLRLKAVSHICGKRSLKQEQSVFDLSVFWCLPNQSPRPLQPSAVVGQKSKNELSSTVVSRTRMSSNLSPKSSITGEMVFICGTSPSICWSLNHFRRFLMNVVSFPPVYLVR